MRLREIAQRLLFSRFFVGNMPKNNYLASVALSGGMFEALK